MPKRLTRQEMYDLAWSEPMRTVAKTFGISDVGLAKYFHKMYVPVPPRGYWAMKAADKPTTRIAFRRGRSALMTMCGSEAASTTATTAR